MPRPWPPAPATTSRRMAPPAAAKSHSRWPLLRSRMALAASVALLVMGMLFLAGAFQGRTTTPRAGLPVNGPTADSLNDPMHYTTPPKATFPSDLEAPFKPKVVNETLIQETSGTSLHVTVVNP